MSLSSLATQLSTIRQTQKSTSIAPGAPTPTLLLPKSTAKNTTIDVLYTMAILGYDEIKKKMFANTKKLAEELLS